MKNRTRALVLALAASLLALPALPASAADPTPTVTISSDKAVYNPSTSALFKIVVTGAGSGKVLGVRITYPNGAFKDIAGTTTYGGTHTESVSAYINATVTATVYTAEEPHEPLASASAPLRVRTRIASTAPGYHTTSGGYLVYSKGSSPKFRSYLTSYVKLNRCLRHVVQRRSASGWTNVFTSACRAVDSKGRLDWIWQGKHASGVKFRVVAKMPADRYNVASAGKPIYFKFR